ncbi:MAG: response regulator [Chloroflexi bacterium]|nr:response regulator [Chloroflexota bacterium]
MLLVGPDGRVSHFSSRLESLTGIRTADVVGQPHSALFLQLAARSSTPDQVTEGLRSALQKLQTQPEVSLPLRDPARRLTARLFPSYTFNGGVQVNGWGAHMHEAAAPADDTARTAEHLEMVTNSLRSSTATIKGSVTSLLSGHRYWGETERQRYLENLDEHVDQLSRLLDNAQELARLNANAVEMERRVTSISELLQRVIQDHGLRRKSDRLTLDAKGDLPPAEIDAWRVEQALHNLLDAAAQSSPAPLSLTISARVQGDEIQVSLSDQGTGAIPESLAAALGDSQRTSLSLGLYVARGLILAHGGSLWSTHANGTGAFHLTLPLKAHEAKALPQSQLATRAQRQLDDLQPQATNGLALHSTRDVAKILVVDDDGQMLRLLKIKLELEGFEVLTATRGSIALELAAAEQPDVILLDINLPDSNGFELCARLREFTPAPIIMVTANSKEEDMVRGLELGADDYLIKPVRNKELLARVRANLRRVRVPEESGSKPVFRTGDLAVDFAQRQVTVRNQQVRLTPTEYKLLYHLAANAGRILTHSQLLAKVWGPGYEEDTQYLWVNISRLRGKIEQNPSEPEYILTEPGVGYYLPAS